MSHRASTLALAENAELRPELAQQRLGRWEWPWAVVAAIVATCHAIFTLGLYRQPWSVPISTGGDAMAVMSHATTDTLRGWYEYEPHLGWPAGQHYHDFPTADNLHQMVFSVFGHLWPHPAEVVNSYYLAGFALTALAGYWFFRVVGISQPMSAGLAVLYSIQPYHYMRSIDHLFLASYYVVPPAVVLVWRVLRGLGIFIPVTADGIRPGRRAIAWRSTQTLVTVVLLGTASTYYSVFLALFLGLAGLAVLFIDRNWRRFVGAALAGAVLVATMLANMLPDLTYDRSQPPNVVALNRAASDSEFYGFKITQLLLPPNTHFWGPARWTRAFYDLYFPLPSESPSLGLIGAIGFLVLLGVAVWMTARWGRGHPSPLSPLSSKLSALASLNLVGVLFGTVGSLSGVIALFVTTDIRGWNRISVFISCFALATVGLLIDALARRMSLRWATRHRLVQPAAVFVAAGLVLAVGGLDQSTFSYNLPADQQSRIARWNSDDAYVKAVETRFGATSKIFELPYRVFPESPPMNGSYATDDLLFYLHSPTLYSSTGDIQGRATSDWAAPISQRPTDQQVRQAATIGFNVVSIDRMALGADADGMASALTALLGAPQVTSTDNRYQAWSLAPAKAQVEARYTPAQIAAERADLKAPPMVYGTTERDRMMSLDAQGRGPVLGVALLDNPRSTPQQVTLTVHAAVQGVTVLDVTVGDGPSEQIPASGGFTLQRKVTAPPGRTQIDFRVPVDQRAGYPSLSFLSTDCFTADDQAFAG